MNQGKDEKSPDNGKKNQKQAQEANQATNSPLEPASTAEVAANQGTDKSQQPVQMPRWKATLVLGGFYTIGFCILFGLVLYSIGKLPQPILIFAGSVAGIIALIGGVWGLLFGPPIADKNRVLNHFQNIQHQANRPFSLLVAPLAAIVILALPYVLFTPFSGKALIDISTPTPTANVTPMPTLVPTKWLPVLKQVAPNCNNPNGVEWLVYSGGTNYKCYSSGMAMRQTASTYGEMDLTGVNGGSYDQTDFRVQINVAFQRGDTTTWAALLVQTPAAASVPGGYIFTLNPGGHCELQYVASNNDITIVPEPQPSLSIDPQQLISMTVIVQNNVLYAYVNNQQVFAHPDNLGTTASDVGLIVEGHGTPPSSFVEFSNFELDKAG